MPKCDHKLVFEGVHESTWFVHRCELCDELVLSNRIEGEVFDKIRERYDPWEDKKPRYAENELEKVRGGQ